MSFRLVALGAMALLWLAGGQAMAQSAEYQPVGARIGSVFVYPKLEVSAEYNDNIYLQSSSEEDDLITRISPSVSVQSDWSRHAMYFNLGGELGLYADSGDDDYEDFNVGLGGRLDVVREFQLYTDFAYQRLHENRGNDNIPATAAEPVEFNLLTADLIGRFKPSRFGVEASVRTRVYDYEAADLTGGGSTSSTNRDRYEFSPGLKLSYDFSPGYSGYVYGQYDVREYDRELNTGFDRDSEGFEIGAGVSFEATRLIDLDFSAGYTEESYDDPALNNVDGLALHGGMSWYATQLTTVTLDLDSRVEETTVAGTAGYLRNSALLGVSHELRRNIVLNGNLGYTSSDWQGGATDRNDDTFTAGLGARYALNRNFYLGAKYRFTTNDSDAAGQDYDENSFMITGGAQF